LDNQYQLKDIDLNNLMQLFEYLNDVLTLSVCLTQQSSSKWMEKKSEYILNEMITHIFKLLDAIAENLDENEFEGITNE